MSAWTIRYVLTLQSEGWVDADAVLGVSRAKWQKEGSGAVKDRRLLQHPDKCIPVDKQRCSASTRSRSERAMQCFNCCNDELVAKAMPAADVAKAAAAEKAAEARQKAAES